MKISAICCTYGRVKRLQEALACFLNQDWPDKELIIYNSFPDQKLAYDHPQVKIINEAVRPVSLGACRNAAIKHSTGHAWVVWDDDDLYLPHHLRVYAEAFQETGADWVRVRPEYYAERWEIKNHTATAPNSVACTRNAWEIVQGYPNGLTVGEDQHFFKRISELTKGATISLLPHEMSLIMCWGNEVYHVSGQGDDKKNAVPAYVRSRQDLERRVRIGQEPIGHVQLSPMLEHDPVDMVKTYLGQRPETTTIQNPIPPQPVCVVELGRYGDIINILPILHHIHNEYGTPHLAVSEEFADLLDGVSYVKPFVLKLKNNQLMDGMAQARAAFPHVLQAQIWGDGWAQERKTEAYNKESWRMCGFQHKFHDELCHMRPVFDRMNDARAEAVMHKCRTKPHLPAIVVNVTHGTSSPFREGPELLAKIKQTFENSHDVIDIGGLKLDRIYDLIPLLNQAACIVSIDTALIHLAGATLTPVVALVNPNPWQGSLPRCNLFFRGDYNWANKSVGTLLATIAGAASKRPNGAMVMPGIRSLAPQRRIFHVVERHKSTAPLHEQARVGIAQLSWDAIYERGVIPCHYWHYKRTAREIGEERPLPFLKDVLQHGMDQASDDDIIMWTNDDNWLHPKLPDMVLFHASIWGAVCSHRCEFISSRLEPGHPPEWYAKKSNIMHYGRDLFAATKSWLLRNWDDMPDFILGCSEFDLWMAAKLRFDYGLDISHKSMPTQLFPSEMPRGYISHTYHPPKWNSPNYVNDAAGQKWNRRLFAEWTKKHIPGFPHEHHFCS